MIYRLREFFLADAHALETELAEQRSKAQALEDSLLQSQADGQASSQQLHELQIQAKTLDDKVKESVSTVLCHNCVDCSSKQPGTRITTQDG